MIRRTRYLHVIIYTLFKNKVRVIYFCPICVNFLPAKVLFLFLIFIIIIILFLGGRTTAPSQCPHHHVRLWMTGFVFERFKQQFQNRVNHWNPLRKKCPYLELFWSVFSRIRTEYGEIRTLRIQSEWGKIWTRITPNTDTFYAVAILSRLCSISRDWAYE